MISKGEPKKLNPETEETPPKSCVDQVLKRSCCFKVSKGLESLSSLLDNSEEGQYWMLPAPNYHGCVSRLGVGVKHMKERPLWDIHGWQISLLSLVVPLLSGLAEELSDSCCESM
ncbi:hypothetical protein KIL84_005930 [Mauremys mutica]|uniref:Uncharacterized protein n=1 Tax=Mauremys mutica TaxID=74926 RepID=A0A9D4B4F5_9SAUR|nr:hypothetical protein KIL84_005930 [Mauremys mutica]